MLAVEKSFSLLWQQQKMLTFQELCNEMFPMELQMPLYETKNASSVALLK